MSESIVAAGLEREALRTPRSASVAGIIFAVLACWIGFLFPLWIFVLSVYILIAARKPEAVDVP
ncbi:MAG TPA: hypothetical protein VGQ38_01055 [Gaiellaceae bacterium]|nr:hypothetical protein [Gaiellaceae bacterium]